MQHCRARYCTCNVAAISISFILWGCGWSEQPMGGGSAPWQLWGSVVFYACQHETCRGRAHYKYQRGQRLKWTTVPPRTCKGKAIPQFRLYIIQKKKKPSTVMWRLGCGTVCQSEDASSLLLIVAGLTLHWPVPKPHHIIEVATWRTHFHTEGWGWMDPKEKIIYIENCNL